CGADAVPYFPVFNPVTQAKKFDPRGEYIRRWIAEIADLPTKWIFSPSQAPAEFLKDAGVELGRTYPEPIVGLIASRQRALAAYEKTKSRRPAFPRKR